MATDTGSVVTVEGRVEPDELGVVLPHEHLFIDLIEAWWDMPDSAVDRRIAREPVSLENLGRIRRNPLNNKDNGRLESVEEAIDEAAKFHRSGGGTIVDVTPKNTGGDPELVRAVARETGLHAVHGTAYYTKPAHPERLDGMNVAELAEEFERDVTDGFEGTDIRAGMVGELGVSDRIHDAEEKVLRAGARAARATGAPLNVHPPGRSPEAHQNYTYPSSQWGLDVLDILEEEGLSPDRVVLSHMDRTRLELESESLEYQRQLADRGAYLEYDLWGTDMHQEKFNNGWPSDPERIDAIVELVDDGYASSLLFSQDVCMKVQRTRYGGFGYAHILDNVVPILRHHGVERDTVEEILVENPRRMLTFDAPEG
jgi:phosphotriesterase-related protein